MYFVIAAFLALGAGAAALFFRSIGCAQWMDYQDDSIFGDPSS